MKKAVTLEQFYKDHFPPDRVERWLSLPHLGHFNVFPRGVLCRQLTQFCRRDYLKISFVKGSGLLHYPDRTVEIRERALLFSNPALPYFWEATSEEQAGYFCLFNNQFISPAMADSVVKHSPLFNAALHPVYHLDAAEADSIEFIFRKMAAEVESDYIQKYDLLRHCLMMVFHEAHKLQPANNSTEKYLNASVRISSLFIEMLERQFPVDSTEHALSLKTPADFARRLSVHVNHLNRAIREVTGKSTSELIAARVATEARQLLRHTDNSISEIAYSLGFEHPSNFNTFFKKHTGLTPKTVRMDGGLVAA